jgi:hypothetical protein
MVPVLKLRLVGSDVVRLGASELGFEAVGGDCEIASSGFELVTEAGELVVVRPGTPLRMAALEGCARRREEPRPTSDEWSGATYSYELPGGTELFAAGPLRPLDSTAYRGARFEVAHRGRLVLCGRADLVPSPRSVVPVVLLAFGALLVFVLLAALTVLRGGG